MLIINKYENNCKSCGQGCGVDTQVEWTKGTGITHVVCPRPEDKYAGLKVLSYKESRELTNCQLCESEANYANTYYYETYRLCQRCWEEQINDNVQL